MTTPYQYAVLADSPIHYVPGNETADPVYDVATGETGNTQNNGYVFGVAIESPLGDYGLEQNVTGLGTITYNGATWSPEATGSSTAISFEAWVRIPTAGGDPESDNILTDSYGDTGFSMYIAQGHNNKLALAISDGTTQYLITGPDGATLDVSHHVVLTYDFSTGDVRLYIDGVISSSIDAWVTGITVPTTLDVAIGKYDQDESVYAIASNVAVYASALSAEQVAAHYAAGTGAGVEVPDISGLTPADATTSLGDVGLLLGSQTGSSYSDTVAEGSIISQDPAAGTSVDSGSYVNYVLSLGPAPSLVTVPNVVGLQQGDATATITGRGLVVGSIILIYSADVPVGSVITQSPAAGEQVYPGTEVNIVVSLGAQLVAIPDVRGMTAADARTAIEAAGFTVGTIGSIETQDYAIGEIAQQDPVGGIIKPAGYKVNLWVAVFIAPFDVNATVISQYANSPVLLRLVENMAAYVDPRTNLENFYNFVWNVDTAQGFGLDIWGRIVGVSRLLRIEGDSDYFGFDNDDVPEDWQPFNQAPFYGPSANTSAYLLEDEPFRVLILTKALANIVATTAPSLNALLQNLFPDRGVAYVKDNGGMSMTYYFEFALTTIEYAILTQSGALPHPAGVRVIVDAPGAALNIALTGQSVGAAIGTVTASIT